MKKFDAIVLGALDIAQHEALQRNHTQLDAVHLLWGLLESSSSYCSSALESARSDVTTLLDGLATSHQETSLDSLTPSNQFNEWITNAGSRAAKQGRQEINESDLAAFLADFFPTLPVDWNVFKSHADAEHHGVPDFLIDLNALAEKGQLDPVIGSTKEIRSVMEILGRRGKNNPVLVGLAGVGKTAIVEGLADAIFKENVPDVLVGKTVYSLDLGGLMAGTKYRGEFEERMQSLLAFMKSKSGQAILFIDEIHQLVGAGKTDGAMDAANLLKPALARGELHCIGATTHDEYQRYILNDAALERRFRPVTVEQPSVEDAIEILIGIKEKFEIHHGIKVSDDAIYQAVVLSHQYITDKQLPDKAIDFIDEASSAMKLSAEAMPSDLVEMESDIRSKKIYAQMDQDNDELVSEIDALELQFAEKKSEWETQVASLKRVSELKNKLDKYRFDYEQANRAQDYETASKLQYGLIPELEARIAEADGAWVLTGRHVAEVISRQTDIPVEKMLRTKQDAILKLEAQLNTRVLGQVDSVREISDVLVAAYAGLNDETRPLASFLLKGPSGVGKTETAKALCEFMFNGEDNLLRFDLSEFSEKHSVAKLIGAPAGYVGYEEGGVLTEAVRRRPHSVVLFDEIEKAHVDFADILLQVLDDGRLTDNKGRTINFKNTVILLTTNATDIEGVFKPEVIGRLDAVLEFNALDRGVMNGLIDKQLALLNDRLKARQIEIELAPELRERIALQGYDEVYGARPLNAVFSRCVLRPLSKLILQTDYVQGLYVFDVGDGQGSLALTS
ncbi:MAG: AAA family ATPase [Pseudomonadota bacterium]